MAERYTVKLDGNVRRLKFTLEVRDDIESRLEQLYPGQRLGLLPALLDPRIKVLAVVLWGALKGTDQEITPAVVLKWLSKFVAGGGDLKEIGKTVLKAVRASGVLADSLKPLPVDEDDEETDEGAEGNAPAPGAGSEE